jgi:hypothetical protein
VLLVGGLLGLWLLLHLTWPLLTGKAQLQPDRATPEELGYDLSTCLIPKDQIVYGAPPGSIPPLVNPKTVKGSEAEALNKEYRRKYHHKFVVTGDRVIGVTINGESRAYQLKLLQWHEVCNDVLGGMPIAVTYSPLCDSVVVFYREINGQSRDFRSTGFLYSSNSLLADFDPKAESDNSRWSLWTQLDGQAVAGSDAWGKVHEGAWRGRLTMLPCEVTHWGSWLARHPDTTLLSHDTGINRKYTQNAYGAYYDRMKLRFPVGDIPAGTESAPLFERCIAWQEDGKWVCRSYAEVKVAAGVETGVAPLVYEPFGAGMEPDSVRLTDPSVPVVYGLRFALEAFGYCAPDGL